MNLEMEIQSAIISWLEYRGYKAIKVPSGDTIVNDEKYGPRRIKMAPKGTPDILTCIQGHMVWIEVKESPEEHAEWERHWQKHQETKTIKKSWERSIYQHAEQEAWRKCGAEIIVVSSVAELEKDIAFLLAEYASTPSQC